jgi:hypothetical protein
MRLPALILSRLSVEIAKFLEQFFNARRMLLVGMPTPWRRHVLLQFACSRKGGEHGTRRSFGIIVPLPTLT